jgi:5-methylcytosine-specific restriction endonuclease McrA
MAAETKDVRVALTFDFDAFCVWIGTLGAKSPSMISRGEFGPIALRHILDLLDRFGIKSTFFIPGHSAVAFPEPTRMIRAAGHEIGHHGWVHENPAMLTPEQERHVLERGLEALDRIAGVRPVGYRWEGKLAGALDKFLEGFLLAKAHKDSPNPDEFWIKYGQWTRVNSDRGDTIARRHSFYMGKIFEYLAPLQMKDPKRLFGELEREIVFFRSHKTCAQCDSDVPWNDAEVHHVIEHTKGGATNLANAALVHSACHPKGEAATKAFAEKFFASQTRTKATPKPPLVDSDAVGYLWKSRDARLFLPHGTEIRMPYKGVDHYANVQGADIIYKGKAITPGQLANSITKTSRNAWRDLWIKFSGDDDWTLADNLRSDAPLESLA